MIKEYNKSSRCKYVLKVHLILVVKYRKKLLINALDDLMKQIMFNISSESDFEIEVMESDKDHIHLLINYSQRLSISSISNRLKSISTNRIWRIKKEELSKEFWKENTFWSDGYFCCSVGECSSETIKRYIEEQG